jgi:hypothetical protein
MEKENIKLSIILCSRNDHYCGDSVGRLESALNHTGEIFAAHNVLSHTEIILTDWGSNVPLNDVLKLNDETRSILRINYIDPSITKEFPAKFSEVHALNSAARLARGTFIGRIDQDTLIGDLFIKWFFSDAVSSVNAYFSNRRDMTETQSIECVKNSIEYIRINGKNVVLNASQVTENDYWKAAVGILLVPRIVWWKIRGYNEKNIYTNHMEHEFCARLNRECKLINLGPITDCDFFHIFHARDDNTKSKKNFLLSDKRLATLKIVANGNDWGTCNYKKAEREAVIDRLTRPIKRIAAFYERMAN